MQMYAGQFGLNGFGLSDAMAVILRPSHWLAYALGIACVMVPLLQGWVARQSGPGVVVVATLWPIIGFLFSFALIASRGAVPFLYFQF
jgi:alginate O-acetyltransferase complex protein AlgI